MIEGVMIEYVLLAFLGAMSIVGWIELITIRRRLSAIAKSLAPKQATDPEPKQ